MRDFEKAQTSERATKRGRRRQPLSASGTGSRRGRQIRHSVTGTLNLNSESSNRRCIRVLVSVCVNTRVPEYQ